MSPAQCKQTTTMEALVLSQSHKLYMENIIPLSIISDEFFYSTLLSYHNEEREG